MTASTTCRRTHRGTPTGALTAADEELAHALAGELAQHPDADHAAHTLDRLAATTSARSVADAHLARLLRRALDLYRTTPHAHDEARNKP